MKIESGKIKLCIGIEQMYRESLTNWIKIYMEINDLGFGGEEYSGSIYF